MSVYFGDTGTVNLKRKAGHATYPTLEPSDVSVVRRRFTTSGQAVQVFITGDEVEIERTDKDEQGRLKNLELVKDHDYPDWFGYVYVDEVGGLRLYKTFEDAITGEKSSAYELIEPTETQNLKIQTRNTTWNCLARVKQYDFTTARETIDLTHLGENVRTQYDAGLISGQGQLDCFWEHTVQTCGQQSNESSSIPEFPAYLAQLCIRLVQGADFFARFFVYNAGTDSRERSVWYEAECIVTNCTVTVPAAGVVETTINFVTTGRVSLRTGYPPVELLQENQALLLQENGEPIIVSVGED